MLLKLSKIYQDFAHTHITAMKRATLLLACLLLAANAAPLRDIPPEDLGKSFFNYFSIL